MAVKISTLKNKMDSLWAEYIRLKGDDTCVICGNTTQPNCGHVFSRRYTSLRWDEANCFVQCYPCNFRHTKDTVPYYTWYMDKFGREAFDKLYRRWRSPRTVGIKELRIMIADTKEKIETLKPKPDYEIEELPF